MGHISDGKKKIVLIGFLGMLLKKFHNFLELGNFGTLELCIDKHCRKFSPSDDTFPINLNTHRLIFF